MTFTEKKNLSTVVAIKTDKRVIKPKLEIIQPKAIVEVWRLYDRASQGQTYPDISEVTDDVIQSYLLQYLQAKFFLGLIARIGKKPVGLVMGDVRIRPYGNPLCYVYVDKFFVDPQYRKTGIGKALRAEFTAQLNQKGVFYYESIFNKVFYEGKL
jgi:predicted N-acetyltransferase YhbS